MTAEWRKVETAPLEGATDDHTAYEYKFGAEIDGVFVAAVTKSGGYIDHLVAIAKSKQGDTATTSSSSTTSQPSSPTTDQPSGDQPSGDQPSGDQPAGSGGESA